MADTIEEDFLQEYGVIGNDEWKSVTHSGKRKGILGGWK
jgi:hypothetical protein